MGFWGFGAAPRSASCGSAAQPSTTLPTTNASRGGGRAKAALQAGGWGRMPLDLFVLVTSAPSPQAKSTAWQRVVCFHLWFMARVTPGKARVRTYFHPD